MSKALHNVIFALALLSLGLYTWSMASVAAFPYGINYGEGPILDQASRLLRGDPLYKNKLDEPPYVISNYPPVYIGLTAGVSKLSGLPLLQAGRGLSIAAALAGGLILGALAKNFSGKVSAGLLAAAFFLGSPITLMWSGYARVDMVGLMFTLLGMWLVYYGGSKWWGIGLGGICLVAAIFTRQTAMLAGPLACAAWLWGQDRRRALILVGWVGGLALACFGILNIFSRGGFYLHTITANANPFDFSRLLDAEWQMLRILPVIFGIGLVKTLQGLVNAARPQAAGPTERSFLDYGWPFFTVGALVVSFTAGKLGSDVNYFLELTAACSLWAAVSLAQGNPAAQARPRLLSAALLAQVVWMLIGGVIVLQSVQAKSWKELGAYQDLEQRVKTAAQAGIVLADDHLDLLLLAGQPIYYQPLEYWLLYADGGWDPAGLAAEIDQQLFPLILISSSSDPDSDCCWPAELVDAIQNSYEFSPGNLFNFGTPKE